MAAVASINSLGKYALNPRGNLWLNDENRFGLKLLLKMGWNKGKGLGKNEDGIAENVRLNYKNDNLGVGFKDKMLLGVQNQEYDSLLSNLNKGHSEKLLGDEHKNDEKRGASLEKRSQKFRNRLHYQKFVRGKDVSRYSDKDMKSIFIVKKSPTNESELQSEEFENSEGRHPISVNTVQDLMVTYKSELSVADYFAKKLKEKSGITIFNSASNDLPNAHSINSAGLQQEMLESPTEASVLRKKRKRSADHPKKHKKLKLGKCKSLKSCLKLGTKADYSLKKKVSFCESVSYQVINSDFEEEDVVQDAVEDEILSNETNNNILDDRIGRETFDVIQSEILSDTIKNEVDVKIEPANHLNSQVHHERQDILNNDLNVEEETEIQELEPTDDSCFSLPSLPENINSYYDSWRESQKQALKMSSYKNMLKKIKKHPVLKTTNLLAIKGYGNWGF